MEKRNLISVVSLIALILFAQVLMGSEKGNYSNWSITTQTYSETDDLEQAVLNEMGTGWKIADWNDILAVENDIDNWITEVGIQSSQVEEYLVTLDGNHFYNGNRHYFISRHDHNCPANFLVHDQIDNHLIDLGSWYNLDMKILCIKSSGKLYISEVCDNKSGEDEGTGFIELYNNTGSDISLDGYTIMRGTNDGSGFVSDGYSYTIPNGYTIQNKAFFTIGNGATLTDFNNAWLKSLISSNYDEGSSSLSLTSGKAYALNDGSKTIIDETPEVGGNQRVYQTSGDNWTTDSSSNGTPGEFGNDTPLPVVLSSFTAVQTTTNLAQINWTTQSENGLAGYNIYRNTSENPATGIKINQFLISASNTSSETNYSFTDETVESGKDYFYWLESINNSGNSTLYGPTSIHIDEENIPTLPDVTVLKSAYPNPFNPITTIAFDIKEGEIGTLTIYNLKGQKVISKEFGAGSYKYKWKADKNVSGVYLYKLQTESYVKIKKMIMLK